MLTRSTCPALRPPLLPVFVCTKGGSGGVPIPPPVDWTPNNDLDNDSFWTWIDPTDMDFTDIGGSNLYNSVQNKASGHSGEFGSNVVSQRPPVATINGLNVMDYPSGQTRLMIADTTLRNANVNKDVETFILAHEIESVSETDGNVHYGFAESLDDSSVTRRGLMGATGTASERLTGGRVSDLDANTNLSGTSNMPGQFSVLYGVMNRPAGTLELWENSVLIASTTLPSSGPGESTPPLAITLGNREDLTRNFGGKIAGFIDAVGEVKGDRQALYDGYFYWKFGEQASLPLGHRFENGKPVVFTLAVSGVYVRVVAPEGASFIVDGNGDYIVDGNGNYVYTEPTP